MGLLFRILFLFSCALLPLFASPTLQLTDQENKWLREHPVIRAGADQNWPPFEFVGPDGSHSGIASGYLELLEKRLGVRFQVIPGPWAETIQKAKEGKVAFLSCAGITQERKAFFTFTRPYIEIDTIIVARKERNDIHSADDLEGLTIALPRDNFVHNLFKQHYPEVRYLFTRSNEEALEAVSLGKADAYVGNLAVAAHFMEKNLLTNLKMVARVPLAKTRLAMAVRKDLPLLASALNKALASVTEEERQQLTARWLPALALTPPEKSVALTREERRWIREHPVVRTAGDPFWPPTSFYDEHGKYAGIIPDYLALVAKRTGLTFENRRSDGWDQTMAFLNEKKVDLIDAITPSPERGATMSFSDPHLVLRQVIIGREDLGYVNDLSQIADKRVALISGFVTVEYLARDYPEISPLLFSNAEHALQALARNEVDAFIIDIPTFDYYSTLLGLSKLKVAGLTPYEFRLSFGVPHGENILLSILNKGLASIDRQERNAIYRKWISIEYEPKTDYALVFQILGGAVLVFLVLFLWNRKLVREIRRRKTAERALRRERKRLAEIIDFLPDPTFVIDHRKQVIAWNRAMTLLTGVEKEEILGSDDYSIPFRGKKQPILIDYLDKPLETVAKHYDQVSLEEGVLHGEIFIPTVYGGTGAHLWLQAAPLLDPKGRRQGAIQTIKDISEIKMAQMELEVQKHKAELATLSKSEFLANMSHEIRTPMNSVLGFAEMLEPLVEEPRQKKYLEAIRSGGKALLGIINDILDLSKIEAGKMRIQPQSFHLGRFFQELEMLFRNRIEEKGLEFLLELDESLPDYLVTDDARIRQILINLVGNAVKFTEKGSIRVTARARWLDEHRSRLDLELSVADTGTGIAPKERDRIFHAFEQVHKQLNQKAGGTGLGLAISSKLAHLLGGALTVESEEGKGSTFTLRLADLEVGAVAESTDPEERECARLSLEGVTILVADDVENNRVLLSEMIRSKGGETLQAENGQEVLDTLAKGPTPDLLLMDIRMPVMDGFETAERIRKLPACANLPLVAVSASIAGEEKERQIRETFDGYLVKPVSRSVLILELCRHLSCRTVGEEPPSPSEEKGEETPSALSDEEGKALTGLFGQEWEEIRKNQDLDRIRTFTRHLASYGEENRLVPVTAYATRLEKACDDFDIALIVALLEQFPPGTHTDSKEHS